MRCIVMELTIKKSKNLDFFIDSVFLFSYNIRISIGRVKKSLPSKII